MDEIIMSKTKFEMSKPNQYSIDASILDILMHLNDVDKQDEQDRKNALEIDFLTFKHDIAREFQLFEVEMNAIDQILNEVDGDEEMMGEIQDSIFMQDLEVFKHCSFIDKDGDVDMN